MWKFSEKGRGLQFCGKRMTQYKAAILERPYNRAGCALGRAQSSLAPRQYFLIVEVQQDLSCDRTTFLSSLGQLHLDFHRVLLERGYLHVWGWTSRVLRTANKKRRKIGS
jgi:hypothetical protein